jgi:hypothetical protein
MPQPIGCRIFVKLIELMIKAVFIKQKILDNYSIGDVGNTVK